MYSVKLDEQNYFTGSYAKVGSIPGGVQVTHLPDDMSKAIYYKYGPYTVKETILVEDIDPITEEPKVDEEGQIIYKEQIIEKEVIGWKFDNEKYVSTELKSLIDQKVKSLDSYKHEKRMYFPYGKVGGIQRFDESTDLPFIQITLEGLKTGIVNEIEWKYSNGQYEHLTKEEAIPYLENMAKIGGLLISLAFSVEKEINNTIIAIQDVETLKNFNEKLEFDKVFEPRMNEVIAMVTNPIA